MILDAVYLCYDPSHHPFASDGAVKIENLQSDRPASKIIRAVIRDVGIDASSWESYSLHRCYCKSKGKGTQEVDDLVDPTLTLDELGIGESHWLFIRKRGNHKEVKEDGPSVPASSRKRKRDQDVDNTPPSPLPVASNSKRTASSARLSKKAPAAQVSNLESLTSQATKVATSISKLLGGDQWKTQSIGQIGTIKSRGHDSLLALLRLVKTSLEIPQVSEQDAGLFNSDLVEALARAYHKRISTAIPRRNGSFFDLVLSEYERANELLRGKINQDGSWERGSLSHFDKSALSSPVSRFPLSDSGLSDQNLSAVRAICVFWNNDKWLKQAPLPGLAPVSLKDEKRIALLRQIADLTRVKPGEPTPDGFPSIVLKALRDSIQKNKEAFNSNGGFSKGGWAQGRNVKDALALLKKRVATKPSNPASIAGPSSEASGSRDRGERQVRRRLDGGK